MLRWWWMVRPRPDWSPEECRAQWLIHLIAAPLFAVSCYAIVMSLFSLGLDPLFIVIVGVAPPYVAAQYIARRLSEWLKPDLIKQADANAARRIANQQAAGWSG